MPTLYQTHHKKLSSVKDEKTLRRMALRAVFDKLEGDLRSQMSAKEFKSTVRWYYLAEAHGVTTHAVDNWVRSCGMPLSQAMLFEAKYGAAKCCATELQVPGDGSGDAS